MTAKLTDPTLDSERAIVAHLTYHRLKHGISQRRLAEVTHVTGPYVSMLENGKRRLQLDMALSYAKAVGLKLVFVPADAPIAKGPTMNPERLAQELERLANSIRAGRANDV